MLVAGFGVVVSPQVQLNVCGCANNPASLGTWDNTIDSTYPPGTITTFGLAPGAAATRAGSWCSTTSSLVAKSGEAVVITFIRNAANTPVTLLASGNVTIGGFVTLRVSGERRRHRLTRTISVEAASAGPAGSGAGTARTNSSTLPSRGGSGAGARGRNRRKRQLLHQRPRSSVRRF